MVVLHVSYPELENLADEVILEELHARQHVKHSALESPLREGQEFSRDDLLVALLATASGRIMLADLDYTAIRDGEVLLV